MRWFVRGSVERLAEAGHVIGPFFLALNRAALFNGFLAVFQQPWR